MSLPVYVLVLLAYRRPQSAEAALKYLVLGGTATATFLMGASLLYGSSGSLGIDAFARALAASDGLSRAAVVLVVLAFFLKGAIVPFHAWAPDAYEGASVPVTAYMATIVKAGVLLAVVRLFGRTQLATPMLEIFAALPLRLDRLGQPRGDAPAEPAADDRLQLDRPCRLPLLRPARRRGRAPPGRGLLPARLRPHEPAGLRRAARRRRRRRARSPRQPEGPVPSRPVRGR